MSAEGFETTTPVAGGCRYGGSHYARIVKTRQYLY